MGTGNNKYDISEEMLDNILRRFRYQIIPREIVGISRENFGFFTGCLPRLFEYVWLIKTLGRVEGKRILDIGAGISPMPIYFARRGAEVTTVDNSEMVHSWQEMKYSWNEWGFIDYGLRYHNIHSYHRDIKQVNFKGESFDYIYAVSVFEHLPADLRRALWERLSSWLSDSGNLVLTMDFYKGSSYLWNYSYGKMVEFVAEHGSTCSLEEEAAPFFTVRRKKIAGISDLSIDTEVFLYRLVKKKNRQDKGDKL